MTLYLEHYELGKTLPALEELLLDHAHAPWASLLLVGPPKKEALPTPNIEYTPFSKY